MIAGRLLNGDRKACLLAAMKSQKALCFWCQCAMVIVAEMDRTLTFVKIDHDQVSFLWGGEVVSIAIASADHVIPQWVGGQTDTSNIVAACRACNQDRGVLHSRNWAVLDATGFEPWLVRVRRKRTRRSSSTSKRLTMSLRPVLEQALTTKSNITIKRLYARAEQQEESR